MRILYGELPNCFCNSDGPASDSHQGCRSDGMQKPSEQCSDHSACDIGHQICRLSLATGKWLKKFYHRTQQDNCDDDHQRRAIRLPLYERQDSEQAIGGEMENLVTALAGVYRRQRDERSDCDCHHQDYGGEIENVVSQFRQCEGSIRFEHSHVPQSSPYPTISPRNRLIYPALPL